MEAMRFDASGGGIPRTREGAPRPCATSSGFTLSLWEEGRAHPTCDHHGGVSPPGRGGAPDLVLEFRGQRQPVVTAEASGEAPRNSTTTWAAPHIVPRRALHAELAAVDGRGCSPGGSRQLDRFLAPSFETPRPGVLKIVLAEFWVYRRRIIAATMPRPDRGGRGAAAAEGLSRAACASDARVNPGEKCLI